MKRIKASKRILAVLLSLTMVMVMSNMTVSAAEITQTETVVETVTETQDESTSEEEKESEEATAQTITSEGVMNVSNEKNDTYTADFTDKSGYFVVKANADKSVIIEDNSKGSYTKRLKMGGAGDTEKRSIMFTTSDAATLELDIMSSSDSADRVVIIDDGNGNKEELALTASEDVITLTTSLENAGTYYIYSKESGINIY